MNKSIWYEDDKTKSDMLILVNKIIRLSKNWEDDTISIHLINGEILISSNSMKTLKARIEE